MKMLGLIGGVSPESTVIYYRLLNDAARTHLGGEHSANTILYALDYGVMIKHYTNKDWEAYAGEVARGAKHLKAAGVDALAIASNTSHIGAVAAGEATGLPVIHVMDALVDAMEAAGVKRPLLFGTPFVMAGSFYRPELSTRFDGEALAPNADEQDTIGRIILDELVNGVVKDTSREELKQIVANHDCDGVILGCTELCMILTQDDFDLPVFDTTGLHAAAVSAFAFEGV